MPDPEPLPALQTPWGIFSPSSSPNAASPPTPQVAIPDHTLLRQIGQGAYGEVWLARNAIGQYRAVKILHRRSFSDDRPFEREFAGMQRFEPVSRSHESQLNILHVGRGPDHFYYVMELADDQGTGPAIDESSYSPRTLRSDLLFRGRLPVDECLRIGLALTTALGHLHRHGLVHRDIKPSNIVFVNGIPKLADIGLVAVAERTMSFVGTEGYLPPEGPGTVQADLFSLGKVLYEISSGNDRQQFPELPTNVAELPDRLDLAELNEVLVRACAPDARQRYQTAAEMHADLALLQSGGSVARARSVQRRLRFLARAGALVTALAILAGLGFLYQQRQTREARRLAEENRVLADEKSRVAAEKTALAGALAEAGKQDRDRLVRLGIANGNRLLDEGDPAGALVWFAETLPLLSHDPAAESVHRVRIQQALDVTPRLLRVMPHESGVVAASFSPDGRRVVTGTRDGQLRVWNAADGMLAWGPKPFGAIPAYVRFSRDGSRVFASSSPRQGLYSRDVPELQGTAVLDAGTGDSLFAGHPALSGWTTNQVASAFSPDDRWVAVARPDHVVQVFDLANGHPVVELRGHTNTVPSLDLAADGSLLLSGSMDGTVRLWRLPSGEPAGAPIPNRWSVVRARLSPDGRQVVASLFQPPPNGAALVVVWDLATRRMVGHGRPVRDEFAVFQPPGLPDRVFVQDREEARLRAYDTDSPKPLSACPDLTGVLCWDFSRDGGCLALGNGNRVAQVFDTRTGAALTPPFRHGQWGIAAVQFSPDETQLLTACADGALRLWDLQPAGGKPVSRPLPGAFSLSGSLLVSLNLGRSPGGLPVQQADASILLIDDHLEELHRFRPRKPENPGFMADSSPDGRVWYVDESDQERPGAPSVETRLWRKDPSGPREFPLPHPQGVQAFDFSGDSAQLVTLGRDRRFRYWRTLDGQLDRVVEAPEVAGGSLVDLSARSRVVLWRQGVDSSGRASVRHRLLDLDSGKPLGGDFEVSGQHYYSFFSPDGQRLAFWGDDGGVTVVESWTGRRLSDSIRHPVALRFAQWGPDSRRLLTVGGDDGARIWDSGTGRELVAPMRTAGSRMVQARWSADGRFVVTVSRGTNNAVIVWDATTGDRVGRPLAHPIYVRFAAITPGQHLVTGNWHDPQLQSWELRGARLPAPVLVDYARLLSGRRRGDGGELETLAAGALAELGGRLRAAHPDLFAPPDGHPPQKIVAQSQSRRTAPRAPGTPANLIDLSDAFTETLDLREFVELPRGVQEVGGTRWDIRGIAVARLGDTLPAVPVAQRCARLHFLQYVSGEFGEDGEKVAHWVIRYADGSALEWPLVYGEHVRDCWWNVGQPREASRAEIAWEAHPGIPAKAARLFKATWTNPRPESAIESLELVADHGLVGIGVVAVTAD